MSFPGDPTAPAAEMPSAWWQTPAGRTRARGWGLALPGTPGPLNAITDIAGIEVGYATLVEGDGPLVVGAGPVRTGVTAILPRGRADAGRAVLAGAAALNGNGEMTGAWWIEEVGRAELAITLTNTHSVGLARDATLKWAVRTGVTASGQDWGLPVAAETYDGYLNDINGFHVRDEHVFAALDGARGGPVEEGSVGGGTGMICYGFKGGSGTASRRVAAAGEGFIVGVFVQANFGRTADLVVAGVPVGGDLARTAAAAPADTGGSGSVIAVVATDAPLLPHQLKRLARRVPVGLARTGTYGQHSSGDIFLAVSTANGAATAASPGPIGLTMLPEESLDPLFQAVAEAVEEAVLNALFANEAMTGIDGRRVPALPAEAVIARLAAAGRLAAVPP
jgi:D-aminopeptidase